MSALINFSLRIDKLPKEKFVIGNVSFTDSQTQEEREAKKPKTYLGNGKVVWNDNKIVNATKTEKVAEVVESDLPF
jgi:hypothetical protein